MANAPYSVRVDMTDDETFEFTTPFEMKDGSAFPFVDFSWTYVLSLKGGSEVFRLTDGGSGVGYDLGNGWATFSNPTVHLLCPAQYEHELYLTHKETGKSLLFFDGPVHVSRGNR